jgi:RimJ/RimL family protein N-acetyltransferase
MDYKKQFNNYYNEYLGLSLPDFTEGERIFECEQRQKPINNWHLQHLIITTLHGIIIYSIAPKLIREFSDYMSPYLQMDFTNSTLTLQNFFDHRLVDYTIRRMYRMTIDANLIRLNRNKTHQNAAVSLTKDIMLNNIQSDSEEEKNRVWLRKKDEIEQGRQYVILEGNKIVSYCKISDIVFGGANLVVYTDENYRNKGFGKAVVIEAIHWCSKHQVSPIYWVDHNNLSSIALAKSLGFHIMAEEIVVGTCILT